MSVKRAFAECGYASIAVVVKYGANIWIAANESFFFFLRGSVEGMDVPSGTYWANATVKKKIWVWTREKKAVKEVETPGGCPNNFFFYFRMV